MDKEDVAYIYVCVYIYIYIVEYYSVKHTMNAWICDNRDRPRGYCTKQKSERERQMLHDLIYMWNLKIKAN